MLRVSTPRHTAEQEPRVGVHQGGACDLAQGGPTSDGHEKREAIEKWTALKAKPYPTEEEQTNSMSFYPRSRHWRKWLTAFCAKSDPRFDEVPLQMHFEKMGFRVVQ